jgi:hypothetical protein
MWPLAIDIASIMLSTSTPIRYAGMFIVCAGSCPTFNVVQAWVGSTVPRTRTKRAVTYALINMFGNLSNIYAVYLFPYSSARPFVFDGVTLSCFTAGGVIAIELCALCLRHLNKKAVRDEALKELLGTSACTQDPDDL